MLTRGVEACSEEDVTCSAQFVSESQHISIVQDGLKDTNKTPFDIIDKLIVDYSFPLFPVYTIPSTKRIKFGKSIDQVFDLEEDTEMQQFASNCSAFASPAEDMLEATKKHKSYERFIPHVSTDLQGMDPHLYAQHLGQLLGNGAISVADFKTHFKPSEEWKHEDYELLPLALCPVTRSTLSLVPRHGNVAKVTKKSWRSLS